jgi:hypothetical protein
MKRLTLHRLASSIDRCQHYVNSCKKSPFNSAELSDTCKSKGNKVFRLCYGKYGNTSCFLIAMQIIASSLLCINIFFLSVKAMEANSGSNAAIKC